MFSVLGWLSLFYVSIEGYDTSLTWGSALLSCLCNIRLKGWLRFPFPCWKFLKRGEYQTTWPASWEICKQVKKQQLELDKEQQTGSK